MGRPASRGYPWGMTLVQTTDVSRKPAPGALALTWAGWAASVSVVALVTLALHVTPHVRGIGFFPVLRFAVVTPACVLVAVASAFLYRALMGRSPRPRATLAAALGGLALLMLAGLAAVGPSGLVAAALPALLGGAAALALLIPRFVERPRRSRVGTVALIAFGALEVLGVALALSSERVAPRGPEGLAFDIPRELFDADSRFLTLPSGARVHYVDEGEGETLLFLHGNPAWSFQWRDLIRELRGSYRCIAIDYPGFGLSEAPAGYGFTPREQSLVVEEFMERLQLRDVTLVMQDWGGPIGLGLAGRRPEWVRQVVLGSTWAWPTSRSEPRGIFSVIAGGPLGEFVQVNFNGFASFGIKNGVVRALPSDVLDAYLRPFRPLERRGIAAFYPGLITGDSEYFAEVEAGLPRLADKKALFLWALQDQGFPRSDLERFQRTFPNHRTVELPDANHFFFEDTSAQVASELRAFMSLEPSARHGSGLLQ
ncbi:alpha/beta fold hydrolase [Corallococcus praedator]|uniref:Alpha/beta fold hydrolase n=2 Tax=Myxococcaceae TaxID=31 RepID=A0ABX9QTI1_9BACT|nr:alpha/beta fold hydrolase [Corallococcus sp. CA031C]RKI17638.1 alpha/beta fold hydrolase [Corallococcus praedator]